MKNQSKALLIASILMVLVSPALVLLTNFLMIAFASYPTLPAYMDGFVWFSTIVLLLIIMASCVIGRIIGLFSWRNPHLINFYIAFGSFILVCNAIQLFSYLIGDVRGLAVFCWLVNSAIPALYTAAAYRFKWTARKHQHGLDTE